MSGVTCSAGLCTLAGNFATATGETRLYVAFNTVRGHPWHTHQIDIDGVLNAYTCPACTLVERLTSSGWKLQSVPVPAGTAQREPACSEWRAPRASAAQRLARSSTATARRLRSSSA